MKTPGLMKHVVIAVVVVVYSPAYRAKSSL